MSRNFFNKVLKKFWPQDAIRICSENQDRSLVAADLIDLFYTAQLFFGILAIANWTRYTSIVKIVPLWPIGWIDFVSFPAATIAILLFLLISSFSSAICPRSRIIRILAFLGLFLFVSLENSFGKINHNWHRWLYVSFIFIFLPKEWGDKNYTTTENRYNLLNILWGAQAIILLTYTMSGFWKIYGALIQLIHNQIGAFAPQALARLVADRLLQTGSSSIMGPWLIHHYLVGWPLFIVLIYFEIFAFRAAIRFSLQKLWGIFLILFHIGVTLLMNFNFTQDMLLIAILFFRSPFSPVFSIKNTICELPIWGWILKNVF